MDTRTVGRSAGGAGRTAVTAPTPTPRRAGRRSARTSMPLRVVPEVLSVRVPGLDCDILLNGERWRCRVLREDPRLVALTVVDRV